MPKLAANLSMLFTERPFLDRFHAAAEAGFHWVEYQFPYAEEPREIAHRAQRAGVGVVLHNLPAGDIAAGDRGIACLPDRMDEFRAGILQAVRYAQAAGCRQLNCLAGVPPAGVSRTEAFNTLVDNLAHAAAVLSAREMTLMLEAVNTRTVPGFLVDGTETALRAIRACGADNVRLQFDLFHVQIMEGDLSRRLERLLPWVGHLQIADVPGRNEPGTGELGVPFLMKTLDRLGYEGYVGCEYNPAAKTTDGLDWARAFLDA